MKTKAKTNTKKEVKMDAKTVRLGAFREDPDNVSEATDEEIKRLAGKLKRVPLGLTAMRIAYVTDAPGGGKMVISGNKRLRCLKAAFGEDGEVPAEWFQDVTAMSEAERHEFRLNANVSDGHFNLEKLLEQYSAEEVSAAGLEELLDGLPEAETEVEESVEVLGAPELEDLHLDERMESAKYAFFAFSGGRDSTRAIYLAYPELKRKGKICEAVYIESPCEFPDLIMHIRRVCDSLELPLTCVHPERNYITEYASKGKSPDTIFMDCVENLINKPMDSYIKSVVGEEDYILVRGGQAKQKTSRSKTAGQQVVKSKPNMLIYNPLFFASEEQLTAAIPEWRGYSAGFRRTCCWCCPFQKREQYEALRANYPLLFEELKGIMGKIALPLHEGDTANQKKFRYWEEQGVRLKWNDKRTEVRKN